MSRTFRLVNYFNFIFIQPLNNQNSLYKSSNDTNSTPLLLTTNIKNICISVFHHTRRYFKKTCNKWHPFAKRHGINK